MIDLEFPRPVFSLSISAKHLFMRHIFTKFLNHRPPLGQAKKKNEMQNFNIKICQKKAINPNIT